MSGEKVKKLGLKPMARIVITLLYEMARRGLKMGLATLCVGGGMGMSMIVERM
jgi:acetyl-CoA C-acetyltransferase